MQWTLNTTRVSCCQHIQHGLFWYVMPCAIPWRKALGWSHNVLPRDCCPSNMIPMRTISKTCNHVQCSVRVSWLHNMHRGRKIACMQVRCVTYASGFSFTYCNGQCTGAVLCTARRYRSLIGISEPICSACWTHGSCIHNLQINPL